jgi:hypothetical protein
LQQSFDTSIIATKLHNVNKLPPSAFPGNKSAKRVSLALRASARTRLAKNPSRYALVFLEPRGLNRAFNSYPPRDAKKYGTRLGAVFFGARGGT